MKMMDRIVGLVTPFECISCGMEGGLLCDRCFEGQSNPIPSRCYRCRFATNNFETCKSCQKTTRLKNVWVSNELNGLNKQLLYVYKFNRAQSAKRDIAAKMLKTLPSINSGTVVVPLPTATSRIRQRGFDQSILLAEVISKRLNLQLVNCLVRLTQTRQVGADRTKRLKQLGDAYRIKQAKKVIGKNILLVDDVITTGASLEAAANILKITGAKNVSAVVFAQK